MPLRNADLADVRRFEDGEDWIELRTELTKGEADRLRDLTSTFRLDPTLADTGIEVENRLAATNRELFRLLTVRWSLSGEPTADAYSALDQTSGEWVDDCITTVLRERRERAEKNSGSSKKPRKRASTA